MCIPSDREANILVQLFLIIFILNYLKDTIALNENNKDRDEKCTYSLNNEYNPTVT